MMIEGLNRAVHDIRRHRSVDLASQFNKAGILAVLSRFPGQIKRIDRNAMPSQPRSRIKRHKPERLGPGRVDYLPNINPHRVVDHLELVH